MCFNAARSIVCVETVRHGSPGAETRVSMPHAALCVSRLRTWTALSTFFGVSMPHAALCVSGPARSRFVVCGWRCFNAARSIVCVETCSSPVSVRWQTGFNAARSIVCVGTTIENLTIDVSQVFQCRTQHCVCRDAVSRSPCPARAEKAFWKDALFCAVFGVCG